LIATLNFAGLVLATILAAVAAVVCNWLFLRAMFNLMRPAAVRKTPESATANQPTMPLGTSARHRGARARVSAESPGNLKVSLAPRMRRDRRSPLRRSAAGNWEKGATTCWS
jgi:hypothetical protein